MADGYDLFCFQKLDELVRHVRKASSAIEDEVGCACAKYLYMQGHRNLPVTLIPTRFNVITKGD